MPALPFVGVFGFDDPAAPVEEGIPSQSLPDITTFLRKNGHNSMSIRSDSFASASEMGTGEDLMTTDTTSVMGIVRLFRLGVEVDAEPGFEKSLEDGIEEKFEATELENIHPHALGDSGKPFKQTSSSHLILS